MKLIKLGELEPGALFISTKHFGAAMKSEYYYPNGAPECILFESGEFAHYPKKGQELAIPIPDWIIRITVKVMKIIFKLGLIKEQ